MNSGIYRLDFSNGQFYIGKSENIPKRWKTHQKNFEQGTHTKKMQAVYDAYGPPEYRVIANIHPDHIDVYEGIFIQRCWGPNLLNTTKPRPIDPQLVDRYIDIYDRLQLNNTSCMLWSTLDHCELLEKFFQQAQDADQRIEQLEESGIVIPEEVQDKVDNLRWELQQERLRVQKLLNRTLWQRITNQMV